MRVSHFELLILWCPPPTPSLYERAYMHKLSTSWVPVVRLRRDLVADPTSPHIQSALEFLLFRFPSLVKPRKKPSGASAFLTGLPSTLKGPFSRVYS